MSVAVGITGLERVVFGIEDADRAERSIDLYAPTRTADKRHWTALDWPGVEIRGLADPALPEVLTARSTTRLDMGGIDGNALAFGMTTSGRRALGANPSEYDKTERTNRA